MSIAGRMEANRHSTYHTFDNYTDGIEDGHSVNVQSSLCILATLLKPSATKLCKDFTSCIKSYHIYFHHKKVKKINKG